MAGYIRQSTFVDGDTITAALFNNEYNQLVNAFSNTSGHKHDGTTAEGPVIGLIGDAGETSPNNKVLIDTTNNHIEFYVEVSSNPVQQIYIADGAIIPVTDSDVDLGTSSLYFKDAYIDTVTTTGNVSVGGDLTVTGSATISGNLTFGDADTDSINLAAEIDSDIIPNTNNTYDLGTATKQWRNIFSAGTLHADAINFNGTAITATAAELNILDGVTSTAAELNILDGVTATATEINLLDGVTSTTAELNILDGVTATATEINLLDGVTSTTAELNILDGVTSTAAEINLLDGSTANTVVNSKAVIYGSSGELAGTLSTAAQPNITSVGTLTSLTSSSNITVSNSSGHGSIELGGSTGGFIDLKTPASDDFDARIIYAGSNLQLLTNADEAILLKHNSSTKLATSSTGVDITGTLSATGTITYGNLSDGTITIANFIDDDTFGTASATTLATSESIKAYVDSQVATVDTLSEVLANGNNTSGSNIIVSAGDNLNLSSTSSLQLGTSNKLAISHDDSNGSIINKTGTLTFTNNADDQDVIIRTDNGSGGNAVYVRADGSEGSVILYHYGNEKLATTSSGINVTGTVTADGLNSSDDITITKNSSSAPATLTLDCSDTTIVTDQVFGVINFEHSDSSDAGVAAKIQSVADFNTGVARLEFFTGSPTSLTKAMQIKNTGDISFYEDTGTTAKFFWDASAESLGIGTTSPAAPLHISNTYPVIRLTDSDGASPYGQIINSAGILQLRADDGNSTANSSMQFFVDGGEKARIDSSGNLLVGKTSADDFASAGVQIEPAGQITTSIGGDAALKLNRGTNDGNIIELYKAGTAVGSIGTTGSDLTISSSVTDHSGLRFALNNILPMKNGSIVDAAIDLGQITATNYRFKDLHLSGAANVNTVDASAGIASTGLMNVKADGTNDTVINVGLNTASDHYSYIDLIGDSTHTDYGLRMIRNNGGANTSSGIHHRGTGELFFRTDDAGEIKFEANGSEAMRIDTDGNVGIGTTNPARKLHLQDSGTVWLQLTTENTTGGTVGLLFGDTNATTKTRIVNDAADNLQFWTSTEEKMRIANSGNVGIGTDSPDTIMEIKGADPVLTIRDSSTGISDANATLRLAESGASDALGNHFDITMGNQVLLFSYSGDGSAATEKFRFDAVNNYFGIGTASPSAALEVTGATLVSDDGTDDFVKQSVSGNTSTLTFGNTEGTGGQAKWEYSRGTGKFNGYIGANSAVNFMTVKGTGEVGINSPSNPEGLLHIGSSSNSLGGTTNDSNTNLVLHTTTSNADKLIFSTRRKSTGTDWQSAAHRIQRKVDTTLMGYMQFGSNSDDLITFGENAAERMRIDGGGNVGIGTTNPDANLHISSAGGTELHLQEETAGQAAQIKFTNAQNVFEIGADASPQIFFINTTGNQGSGLCIDTSHNVGIGTSNPNRELELAAANPRFRLTDTDGGYSEISGNSGHLGFTADAGNTQSGTRITFDVDDFEALRINSLGDVIIGKTTSTNNNEAGIYMIQSGAIVATRSADTAALFNRTTNDGAVVILRRQNVTVGSISVTGSATAYNTSSDARLKDVTGEARGLEVINELNPVSYNWKADGKADEGLIAQEVQEIVPNAVSQNEEDEMYQMDYSKLVVHLVKGMKEQQEQIEALQSEINLLKGE